MQSSHLIFVEEAKLGREPFKPQQNLSAHDRVSGVLGCVKFPKSAQIFTSRTFLPLTMVRTPLPELQKMKWPYLVSWAKNKKNKATFFSSTFKV